MSMDRIRQIVGQYGERLAERYLQKRGFRIVARRWRAAGGELDLIALDAGGLIFVEVKNRRSMSCGWGAEAVTAAKRRKIQRAAGIFLARYAPDRPARFGIVQIYGKADARQLTFIDNAFDSEDP